MSIVVRLYSYGVGDVILAQWHNYNEITLYNLVNGNLNDANMKSGSTGLTEDAVYFKTSGHDHSGVAGTGGSKIALTQDTGGDDYLVSLDATAIGNALKAYASTTGKAGVFAQGKNSDAYGLYTDNQSPGVGHYGTNSGLGRAVFLDGNAGLADHTLQIDHNSTNGTAKAGLYIGAVADSDHYGIHIDAPEGVGLFIDRTGTTAQKYAIQVTSDNTTAGIRVDHSGTGGELGVHVVMTGATGDQIALGGDVQASSDTGSRGVYGVAIVGRGVEGATTSGIGVYGTAGATGIGVQGSGTTGYGVAGTVSSTGKAIYGLDSVGTGEAGRFEGPHAGTGGTLEGDGWVTVIKNTVGGFTFGHNALWVRGRSYFNGHVQIGGDLDVVGNFSKGSGGSFMIDHPSDPENKVLRHSFVESPDILNLYPGKVTLDKYGYGLVTMPHYWKDLNERPTITLTPVGDPVTLIGLDEHGGFSVSGKPEQEVYYMVTGVRKDPWVKAHPIIVEEDKEVPGVMRFEGARKNASH